MEKDALMYTVGTAFTIIFFVLMPWLLVALSRHDRRAQDSTELGPEDIGISDLESTSPDVQAALREYSMHRISRAEFMTVAQKARS